MLAGPEATPRDIDVVITGPSIAELESEFARFIRRKTRFGGLVMSFAGWRFDVWPLEVTWAFRNHLVNPQTVDRLPCTTFLNVEAVALSLHPPRGSGEIYSCGFFDAIATRTIDVGLEANPFPDLCVLRALITANKLDFALGPRLVSYIASQAPKYGVERLLALQESHYGVVRRPASILKRWLQAVYTHAEKEPTSALKLPSTTPIQLDVWEGVNVDFAFGRHLAESDV